MGHFNLMVYDLWDLRRAYFPSPIGFTLETKKKIGGGRCCGGVVGFSLQTKKENDPALSRLP